MRLIATFDIPPGNQHQFDSMWNSGVSMPDLIDMAATHTHGVYELKGKVRPGCEAQ